MVPNYINLYLCVYLCNTYVCMYVCGTCVWYACSIWSYLCVSVQPHSQRPEEESDYCSTTLYLVSLKQKFQLTLELGWQPLSPINSPILALQRQGMTGTHAPVIGFLYECWGLELRSSCLCTKYFYSMSHPLSLSAYILNKNLNGSRKMITTSIS